MRDAAEKEIHAGDYIIYAITYSGNAMLRYGRVVDVDTTNIYAMCVKKQHDYRTGAEFRLEKDGAIIHLTTGWNKLIVPRDVLPDEVQQLLGVA